MKFLLKKLGIFKKNEIFLKNRQHSYKICRKMAGAEISLKNIVRRTPKQPSENRAGKLTVPQGEVGLNFKQWIYHILEKKSCLRP